MSRTLTTVAVSREHDVVLARQRARQVASLLGFDHQDQTRVATAISELARNAFEYAGGGRVEFAVPGTAEAELVVTVIDHGPGIAELDRVLDGGYRSSTGMGLGIIGARRLMDRFEIESVRGTGTRVLVAKRLPTGQPRSTTDLSRMAETLAGQMVAGPLGELQTQNQDLMRALDELQARQEELARLNRELEETNRGVVVLYAELEERAEESRRASESKSRFLSNVSHELRTPLNSIRALCNILLDRLDGPLSEEQERQVTYSRDAADGLLALVNELLDLASIEAGKTTVDVASFDVSELFSSLRGMFRPLHQNDRVALVFEDLSGLPSLHTDQSRLSQVLRNFISNALKFTEEGEVRVSARIDGDGMIAFSVADTGIGIAPEDQERAFEEFIRLDGTLQRRAQGTGLGLPVSRRLAGILGGTVTLESTPGSGSTFTLTIPVVHPASTSALEAGTRAEARPAGKLDGVRVLVVDDEESARYIARRALTAHGCVVVEASDGPDGQRVAREQRPDAIILDLNMPGDDGLETLQQLRKHPATLGIPVIIHTSRRLTSDERADLDHDVDALLDKREAGGDLLARTVLRVVGGSR